MKVEKEYKYKFSIVMAVYNVEQYIEESIKSIIQQDIGFKQNIQLILVDDGSADNSGEICRRYLDKYSDNILYVKKENGGVSSARNLGLNSVEGKYVNFLDSDDLLSDNTCSLVNDFFEENYEKIDVVSIPMIFFEGKKGDHILNYKFNETKIIDVKDSYTHVQLSSSSSFVKASVLIERKFDENLKYGEDAKLLTQIIVEKFCYGVVSKAQYLYRIRNQSKSAIQSSKSKEEWYIQTLNNFHLSVIKYVLKKCNYVPRYVQFLLMYDIQWRLNTDGIILSEEDTNTYKQLLKEILGYIDKEVIYAQKNINIEYKKYALYLKYEEDFNQDYSQYMNVVYNEEGAKIYYKDILIDNLVNKMIQVDILKVKNNKLIIEANIQTIIKEEDAELFVLLNNKKYVGNSFVRKINDIKEHPFKSKKIQGIWKIDMPNKDISELKFYIKYKEKNTYLLNLNFGKMGKLVSKLSKSYFNIDRFIFTKTGNTLIIFKESIKRSVGREYRYLQELINKKNYKPALARLIYFLTKPFFKNKKIWVLMDRADKAADNGEYLFRYINENCNDIKTYFVISKESEDYSRIKKIGKVLEYGTYKTKIYYLHAEKVISSQIDENIINPFGGQEYFYRGLMKYDKIFLQHGITKDDLTKWLNKYNKGIDLFITVTKDEYNSILENKYYYNEDVVKLTGFPRYDYLEDRNQKQIVIMPTWRSTIVDKQDITTGKRTYSNTFKETDYFKAWNNLINNKRIIDLSKKMGYKIIFMPHPNIMQQIEDFDKNDHVIFADEKTSYNKLFCESSLLITDYSSVAFDCAYLKKPVIYYQFDRESFFSGHTYTEGYFSYEEMGFGPVYYDEDQFTDGVIEYIENQCKMQEVYKQRVNSFYRYTDTGNCKRVYEEIKKM